MGYSDIKPVTAFEAGNRLRRIAETHNFTMFEFFLTDKAGHEQDKPLAEKVLETLDEFLSGIVESGLKNLTILISSDHGNVENLSVKTHTLNPSLTAGAGEHAEFFKGKLNSIADVTPTIIELIKQNFLG